jgi:hypothetical protein
MVRSATASFLCRSKCARLHLPVRRQRVRQRLSLHGPILANRWFARSRMADGARSDVPAAQWRKLSRVNQQVSFNWPHEGPPLTTAAADRKSRLPWCDPRRPARKTSTRRNHGTNPGSVDGPSTPPSQKRHLGMTDQPTIWGFGPRQRAASARKRGRCVSAAQ